MNKKTTSPQEAGIEAIRQIYANVESDKGCRNYSQGKLLRLIKPVRSACNIFTEGDPLMGCLNIIGKHEKIQFKGTKRNDPKYSQLENILVASRIKGRKIALQSNWYESDGGAYLAFYKEDHSPVALIPKSNGYSAYDCKNKKVIDAVNKAALFATEAYTFFTPFAEGKLTPKSLLSFGTSFIWKDLIYFFLIGIIGALLALTIPVLTGHIFDETIPDSSVGELEQILLLLLTAALSMSILSFAQGLSVLRLEGKLNYKMQVAVWDRLLSLKVRFFSKYAAGDLAERSMGIDKIRGVLSGSVLTALISFIFSIFYLALLFYYSTKLAVAALILGLIIVVFTVIMSYYGFKHIKIIRYLEVVLSGFLFQVINGVSKIRLTGSNERVFSQWVGRYSIQQKHYISKRNINVAGEVFTAFFPIFSAIIIFWQVHKLLLDGSSDFTVGDYISFNNAFLCFQGAMLRISMATVPLLTISPIYSTFKPIVEAESEYTKGDEEPGELSGTVTVSNLSFRYDNDQPMVLDDISFKINPGEYVALVGGSGSGKSTLLRLLLRFEEPVLGQIFLDNKDISQLNILAVRKQMGVVLQNGKLMPGTILYNIIGNSNLTEQDAWEAAHQAGCAREIEELKDKMHTEIAQGNTLLSGGQVQRIIIARALAKKPRILFFDEATSALDNITQEVVSDSIDRMDATRIVIAHRLSTIMNADRIIVLDKGHLVEQGTYTELLGQSGYFAELAKRQIL